MTIEVLEDDFCLMQNDFCEVRVFLSEFEFFENLRKSSP